MRCSCKRCTSGQCLRSPQAFFSCGDTFPFRFSFFQYDLCLILLTIFLCFPFVVPCHFCSSPHTWGYPSSLLTRWISLAGVEEPCVFSLFGRRLSRKLMCEVSLEDGMPRTFTSYGAQKLAWHWKSSVLADTEHLGLILDPNFSEPNVSGYCFYTYLSVLNNSWCPESQLPSVFHTAAI